MKERIAERIYDSAIAGQGTGRPMPPGDWLTTEFGGADDDGKPLYHAMVGNDGFDLYVGYRNQDRWLVSFGMRDALHLARFILWTWWVRGTWCGLRRRIWYWALHVKVTEHERKAKVLRGQEPR